MGFRGRHLRGVAHLKLGRHLVCVSGNRGRRVRAQPLPRLPVALFECLSRGPAVRSGGRELAASVPRAGLAAGKRRPGVVCDRMQRISVRRRRDRRSNGSRHLRRNRLPVRGVRGVHGGRSRGKPRCVPAWSRHTVRILKTQC